MDHHSNADNEEDREKLKQAILECTRTEVVRVLNDILGGGGGLACQQPITIAHRSVSAPHLRPKSATAKQSITRQQLNREEKIRRPTTSHANSKNTRPSLPLESVDDEDQTAGNVTQQQIIDRSSSN